MSEFERQPGKRQAPKGPGLWGRYRAWVSGLSRGARIRYRLCQVLTVLAVLSIGITLYLRAWIKLPDVPDPPAPLPPSGTGSASSGIPGLEYEGAQLPEVTRSGRREGYYTFLLCGRDVVSGATDTMILVTYDTRGQRINAISLLRDTMVNTSGKSGGQKRLNVVFARNMGGRSLPEKEQIRNGMTALKQEVSRLTGIYPDFYVLVEWEAIGNLVDAIDGVEFEVPFDMDYDDPIQDLHIHQKKGYRLLDGEDAMEVIRFRKSNKGDPNFISLGDSGRTQIQRDFLAAVLKKCLTPDILLKVPALTQIFMDNVDTDLTVGNILAFAQLAVGMDAENDVNFVSMPCTLVSYGGASLATANQDELLELLNDGINPYQDEIKASDLQLMYRKKGGGFGVTNAVLADPAVGRSPSPSKPREEAPVEPSGDTSQTGDTSQPADSSGDTSQPERQPGDIGEIDPEDIFPDPGPDTVEGEQGSQAAA